MMAVIISKDGTRHTFTEVSEAIAKDLTERVAHGQGYVMRANEGTIAYAPGDITRVGITGEKE